VGLAAAAAIGAVGAVGGGLISASGAKSAANSQAQANAAAMAEQQRQFDRVQQLLSPYVQAGNQGLSQLMALTGAAPTQTNWSAYAQSNPDLMQAYNAQAGQSFNFNGQTFSLPGGGQDLETFAQQWQQQNDPNANISAFQTGGQQAQQQAISGLEQSPLFQALARQGEQGILQNASATGGLRGGNVQGALGQFRPALLNQQIQQQMAQLGGLASLGQNAAAGVGNTGVQTGQGISALMQDTGQAQAYGALGSANALGGAISSLGNIAGGFFGGSGINAATLGRLTPSAQGAISANPSIF